MYAAACRMRARGEKNGERVFTSRIYTGRAALLGALNAVLRHGETVARASILLCGLKKKNTRIQGKSEVNFKILYDPMDNPS